MQFQANGMGWGGEGGGGGGGGGKSTKYGMFFDGQSDSQSLNLRVVGKQCRELTIKSQR